jgi:Asp-tRNA(Asn)/Glu-tRNA(Gln) amidotransferase A subunit family amidase
MADHSPIFWPVARLIEAYKARELSPVEVTEDALARIAALDAQLHSYLSVTPEIALDQARDAERSYRDADGPRAPLLGVPVSIKDLFDVRGAFTTLGSRFYGGEPAEIDSAPVALLRSAGSVFLGKTNTAEFGQSATTDNLLGPACGNPWDPSRTSGGSSGGAAASVGAGLASMALGSDGGGSIRIPAAMCGLFGIKPTFSEIPEAESFRGMTEFVCAGPITRTVDDSRRMLAVIQQRSLQRGERGVRRRIAWCPSPEAHAIDPGVRSATEAAVQVLADLGHEIEEVSLPLEGWAQAFGPIVLQDEWRYRRHLLVKADQLTFYARRAIEAGVNVTDDDVATALRMQEVIQARVAGVLEDHDFIVTPTTACVAFPNGDRPTEIDGVRIDSLWGPFPFTAPFNVSGSPAASIPVGMEQGMPVGLQVVGAHHAEGAVLDFCEDLEEAIPYTVDEMSKRWGNVDIRN